jgi:hypothetical protein
MKKRKKEEKFVGKNEREMDGNVEQRKHKFYYVLCALFHYPKNIKSVYAYMFARIKIHHVPSRG